MKTIENQKFRNWSHTFESSFEKMVYPKSIEDVRSIVKEALKQEKTIRVVGAGHSFTKLVENNDWILSLDHLIGIEEIDQQNNTVTVLGGTRLKTIGEELGKLGFAQENLGDINVQSIAGAISTGTHGTGLQFGNISSQVLELTIVTANGDVLVISETNSPEYYYAALVSLGSFGVIVKVKLKILKTPIYEYKSDKVNYHDLIKNLDAYINTNRHFEFYMFPYSDIVQVKTMNTTDKRPQRLTFHQWKNLLLENYLFYLLSSTCKLIPRTSASISKLSAWGVSKSQVVSESYQLFATPRLVRFREMEYCIPLENFKDVLQEVRDTIARNHYQVHFPIECRVVKEDNIWLSPSYKRDSAYIAFHMYKGMEYEKYFTDMEDLMKKYKGRPHWGKMHTRGQEELAQIYPKFKDFQAIREKLDPYNIFLNEYLKEIIG